MGCKIEESKRKDEKKSERGRCRRGGTRCWLERAAVN